MSDKKTIKWSNVIMIALLVVIVLIPLVMSQSGKKVNSWSRTMNMRKTIKAVDALEDMEYLEALEGLPELQVEIDSILASIDIPEIDSFIFTIPLPPEISVGYNRDQLTIRMQKGFQYYPATPEIIGGSNSIYEHLVYPEDLKKVGTEGIVTVQVLVEKDGSVSKTNLLKSSGYNQFDKAALEAVKKIKFEHILQDDEPIAIWVALPVFFKLDK